MCSLSESSLSNDLESMNIKKDELKNCKKCVKEESFVVLQKRHSYCKSCFDEMCCHKFRSTVGKSRLVKHGQSVLIAFSGGSSSTALVNLIRQGMSEDNHHRKLTFVPSIIHIDESAITETTVHDELIRLATETGWSCYTCSLSESFRSEDKPNVIEIGTENNHDTLESQKREKIVTEDNHDTLESQKREKIVTEDNYDTLESQKREKIVTEDNHDTLESQKREKLVECLDSIKSLTAKEEFIRRIRIQLMIDVAETVGGDSIMVATNGTRLAAQLITDVAQGKGNQIHLETGFCDNRFKIPILKPMREFVSKEIAFYNRMMALVPVRRRNVSTLKGRKDSLGKASEAFITSLETDFPATIYTLCRISTKITSSEDGQSVSNKIISSEDGQSVSTKITSSEDGQSVSNKIISSEDGKSEVCEFCHSKNDVKNAPDGSALSALQISHRLSGSSTPSSSLNLCYTCQNIFKESNSTLIHDLHALKRSQKDQIRQFLLEEEDEQ